MKNIQNVELQNFQTNPDIFQRSWLSVQEGDTDIQDMPRKKNMKFQHISRVIRD